MASYLLLAALFLSLPLRAEKGAVDATRVQKHKSTLEAKVAAKALLARIQSTFGIGKQGDFSGSGCPRVGKDQLMRVMMGGAPIVVPFRFVKGCDMEGDVAVSRNPFPVDLKLRHITGADRVKGIMTPSVVPEMRQGQVRVSLILEEARLYNGKGPSVLDFSGIYSTYVGFDGRRKGQALGELVITKHKGKPVKIHETVVLE